MQGRSLVFATLLALNFEAFAQTRLLPVDQAASVPDFYTFRARLAAAIARRDAAFLVGILSKDAKLSFGGDSGVDDFQRMWKPYDPDSRVWDVLGTTLALGGTFARDGTFTAPYVFTQWPRDSDAFTHMATLGSGVRVRSAPNASAPVVAALDFAIVELVGEAAADAPWIQVQFGAGKAGYVDARFLRSPIDYRVNFAKVEGQWKIQFFLAGD